MARSCCSTRGPCSVDPICAPARRRCGGGWPPRPWPDRPATGTVFVGAAGGLAAVQALLRWAPAWHAARELADRTELGFPPATRLLVRVSRPAGAVLARALAAAQAIRSARKAPEPVRVELDPLELF